MASRSGKFVIDYYYDVISPYAWIGFEGLLRYQKIWPINVNLKPFFLRDVMVASGNKAPLAIKNKGTHMIVDLERNNDFWGLNLKFPENFKVWIRNPETSSLSAQKILLTIQDTQPELLEKTSRQYWDRIWTRGLPIFSQDDQEIVLKSAGVKGPAEVIQQSSAEKYGNLLKKNTDAAIEQHAFGAPWIVLHKDGQCHSFFGSDRFHLIGHLIGETFTDGKKELAAKL